ncbi:MAG TPA: AAA family ATPase [bacterium]|nr:AAA family ATPase [bacterium]
MNEFKITLSRLLKARFPYIYIPSWEEERFQSIISDISGNQNIIKTPRDVFTWSLTTGFTSADKPAPGPDTKSPAKALEFIEKYTEPAVFILRDFHIYFGGHGRSADNLLIRRLRDLAINLKQNPSPQNVIFISPSVVLPEELQKDITILDFDLPDFKELTELLNEMIEANMKTGRIVIDLKQEEKELLAKAALGLTLKEAENAFARAMVDDGKLDINDVETILEEKRQIIKKSEILEFVKTDLNMNDVGGLENLKKWLAKRNKSWLDRAGKYCLPAPKGMLIVGVPGCGKSLTAKAMSAMWQLPLLRLDIGKIFSGIVGSSEENVRKALKTAEAVAPSILWIDEIEKGFSGVSSSGDSGTSSRVFGTFLTWMQEKTKPVFVIATANNIDLLPAEFMRKGRFDEIFFVDLPTSSERKAIFTVHLKKRLRFKEAVGDFRVTGEILERLIELTEGFSGAEIEQAVISSLFEAYAENRSITMRDFEKAIKFTVPLSVTQGEQIIRIREWANVRAVSATPRDELCVDEERGVDAGSGIDETLSTRGGRKIDV